MPHTFDRVPLQQVEVTAVFADHISLDLDILFAIRESVRNLLPNGSLKVPGHAYGAPVASFTVGTEPAFIAQNEDLGLSVLIYQNAIQAIWSAGEAQKPYVRYEKLKDVVLRAVEASQGTAHVCRIGYRTLIPNSETNLWAWLEEAWQPAVVAGDVLTFELVSAYRLASGVDFRLSSQQAQGGMGITTDAGLILEERSIGEALDVAHLGITEEFVRIVTAEYKEKWGYRS